MNNSTRKSKSSSDLSPEQREQLAVLVQERQRRHRAEEAERLRNDFAAFVRASWSVVDPAMPLIDNWHIDAISEHLQAIAEEQIRFLMINIGPGYAKSVIASVQFSAWLWARDPMAKVIAATYAKALTIRDSLRVRDLIDSQWYQDTFNPGWRVKREEKQGKAKVIDPATNAWTWVKTNEDWLSNSVKGERRALSVGGAATGFRADGQIFDDLLNASDKHSKAARDTATEWAIKTMSSRFNDMRKGWRVVIGQRLHEDDPYGAMLATGDYVHLNLPSKFERERKCCAWCIEHGPTTQIGFTDPRKEEGELLFPTLFTDKVIKQAEKDLGSYDFAGQHQQRPSPAEGGMFKRTFWRWYTREELPYIEMVVISVDCTFKRVDDADFVAIHVYGVCGARFYLLARRHEQMGFRATKDAIRILWDEFKPSATLIEDKANGSAVIEELSREVPGVIAINPEGGKVARAWAAQPTVEAGGMFLPVAVEHQAIQVVDEAAEFPNGKHDDDVDAMTQFLNWIRTNNDFSTWARLGGR
jgi:predicted phage terminase large subunit-like protein